MVVFSKVHAAHLLDLDRSFNLREICFELNQAAHTWFKIGIQLGVPRHKLKEFEKDSDPLSAVVDYWLKGNVKDVPVSWKPIVEALEYVGEMSLADTIRMKYCKQGSGEDEGL